MDVHSLHVPGKRIRYIAFMRAGILVVVLHFGICTAKTHLYSNHSSRSGKHTLVRNIRLIASWLSFITFRLALGINHNDLIIIGYLGRNIEDLTLCGVICGVVRNVDLRVAAVAYIGGCGVL